MMETKKERNEENTLLEDLSASIERLKIAFSIEDLSAWAVSRNADEKVLREAKSLMDAIYSSNYSKRKAVIKEMSGLPREGLTTPSTTSTPGMLQARTWMHCWL